MTSDSAASAAGAAALPAPQAQPEYNRLATLIVAASVGITTMSFNCWWPFLPLYARELGAHSDANALFWVAVATSVQGVARLTSGPVWGVLSDKYGRKVMFLRALFLSSSIGAAAAFLSAPWQLALPLGLAGLFSGFNPAAIALISVSVPDSRLNSSLSMVTGTQYIGTTLGPAFGALLAIAFDYRTSILVASVIPLLSGLAVMWLVPRDQVAVAPQSKDGSAPQKLEPFKPSFQFWLAILLYLCIFALNQLIRLATPISLRTIEGGGNVAGLVGLTFSLGGLISAISVLFIAPRFFGRGRMRKGIAIAILVAAVGHLIVAFATGFAVYMLGFLVVAMVLSAMTPTTSTLIATNASRARRGTAFGIASSAQAISLAIGPIGAAVFAAVSLEAGFIALAVMLVLLATLVRLTLREPDLSDA
jgi:DHA1 family multidrug resistance protein-like MFS transporter